jgi:sulfate permease, SulP family
VNLFRGLRPLQLASELRDVQAGVVQAAMDIPQVLGYSKIAGMPGINRRAAALRSTQQSVALGRLRQVAVHGAVVAVRTKPRAP